MKSDMRTNVLANLIEILNLIKQIRSANALLFVVVVDAVAMFGICMCADDAARR